MGLGRQRGLFTLYHLHEPWVMQVTLLEGIFLEAYPARRFESAWHPSLGPERFVIAVVLPLVIK